MLRLSQARWVRSVDGQFVHSSVQLSVTFRSMADLAKQHQQSDHVFTHSVPMHNQTQRLLVDLLACLLFQCMAFTVAADTCYTHKAADYLWLFI
jgi:hypothetical protein